MPSRRRAPRAQPTQPTFELDGAEAGQEIEVFWKENWWKATVLGKRQPDAQQPTELNFRWAGRSKKSKGAWIAVNDPKVRWLTSDANRWEHHVANFDHAAGHVDEDVWEVEAIIAERGDGDAKQYLIRWHGWPPEDDKCHDTWEPASSILDISLVHAFETERDAERLAAEKAERDERARYAELAIRRLRGLLLAKLRKAKETKPKHVVVPYGLCEYWKLMAIREHLVSLLPEGDHIGDHLTEIAQVKGASGRSKMVEHEFYVASHYLVGKFVDCEPQEPARVDHIIYKRQGAGTAVALLPSLKFAVRWPRSQPHMANLTIKAGFGTLDAQGHGAPTWCFNADVCMCTDDERAENGLAKNDKCVACERVHHGAIARRVVTIAQRMHVNAPMLQVCTAAQMLD